MSILEDVPAGWNLSLFDTPGFGEANMGHITELAGTLFNTSSAYLYVMEVAQMGDETDAKYLRQLCDRDKGECEYA